MQAKSWFSPGPGVRVLSVDRVGGRWVVAAVGRGSGVCPGCGEESTHRHSWRQRRLQDLPIQGANVTLQLRLSRWRCRNIECRRKTFVEQMPEVFPPLARRTRRVAELVHLFGHSAGGKPGERLMGRLGAPVSDDTILRHLKRRVADRNATTPVRVAASTIGVGAKAAHTAQSWWILSGVRS
jgi:transposase